MTVDFQKNFSSAAIAFRGYNITNLGRSRELLEHPLYGPTVAARLLEASDACADVKAKHVDLVARVRDGAPTTLDSFAEDVALIVAMEVAQVELLEKFFDLPLAKARLSFGYSVGEISALACGGTFRMCDVLGPLLSMAPDCASLAPSVTMGVVFSRGAKLDLDGLQKLCVQISSASPDVIAPSAFLSPNTVLLLGQGNTLDRFSDHMHQLSSSRVYLRKNSSLWPPLHTPILWQKNIPNRAARAMQTIEGGFTAPQPAVISLVTGSLVYNSYNAREILHRWVDHPQRLWDAVYQTLAAGVPMVVHVGPEPNLIPATFKRVSDNVEAQLAKRGGLGLRAVGKIWRPWLAHLLSPSSTLLQAPYVEHVILEDWLLENAPEKNTKNGSDND